MIFVCGYVMILDFYYKFNNWDVVNFQEFFMVVMLKKEVNEKL